MISRWFKRYEALELTGARREGVDPRKHFVFFLSHKVEIPRSVSNLNIRTADAFKEKQKREISSSFKLSDYLTQSS
jgi:hypothetical protein